MQPYEFRDVEKYREIFMTIQKVVNDETHELEFEFGNQFKITLNHANVTFIQLIPNGEEIVIGSVNQCSAEPLQALLSMWLYIQECVNGKHFCPNH